MRAHRQGRNTSRPQSGDIKLTQRVWWRRAHNNDDCQARSRTLCRTWRSSARRTAQRSGPSTGQAPARTRPQLAKRKLLSRPKSFGGVHRRALAAKKCLPFCLPLWPRVGQTKKNGLTAFAVNPLISFKISFTNCGRDGGIRTHDPLDPIQVRYLAALRPD